MISTHLFLQQQESMNNLGKTIFNTTLKIRMRKIKRTKNLGKIMAVKNKWMKIIF